MTIFEIYNEFRAGSQGFCIAAETYCGYVISRDEIARIGEKAQNIADSREAVVNGEPAEPRHVTAGKAFERIWENESWWTDEANA